MKPILSRKTAGVLAAMLLASTGRALAIDLTKGYAGVEGYLYPIHVETGQDNGQVAVVGEVEFSHVIDEKSMLRLTPFVRLDFIDSARTKIDFPEGLLEYAAGPWIASAGMAKLSWSVTEAVNVIPLQIVDILNQRDMAGNPNGTEKLGVPVLALSHQGETTLIDGYVVPWFRKRNFPSTRAREHPFRGLVDLRVPPSYASSARDFRPSVALRAEGVLDNANVALIYYNGYGPAPAVHPDPLGGPPTIHYYLQDMLGLTVQAAVDRWLLKTETALVHTWEDDQVEVPDDYVATVTGAEFTFIRPEAPDDLTLIAEWLYDSRGDGLLGSPFQNDLFVGLRWVANDHAGTQVLGGGVVDLEDSALVFNLEMRRRILDDWRIELLMRKYVAPSSDPLYAFEDDLLFQANIGKYF